MKKGSRILRTCHPKSRCFLQVTEMSMMRYTCRVITDTHVSVLKEIELWLMKRKT